jgi:8-hydroxy-5-deazaflavin:NADPH oxidoreductase
LTTTNTTSILGGTGDLGFGLALRLAAAGVPVVIGSRDEARALEAAARVRSVVPGADVEGHVNAVAASAGRIVVVAVPFAAQARTVGDIRGVLNEGQILLDATVPLATAIGGKPTRIISVLQGSAAQQAQEIVGSEVPVVSALHTVAAASLADMDHRLDEDVLLCGDRRADKEAVSDLLERVPGLRCVDAGRLEMSHVVERLTALMVSINIKHKTRAGIKIMGLGRTVGDRLNTEHQRDTSNSSAPKSSERGANTPA